MGTNHAPCIAAAVLVVVVVVACGRCQVEEVARFIARRWYVEHGDTIVPGQLHSLLGDMLPQQLLSGVSAKSRDSWTHDVMVAFDKMGLSANKYSKTKVN